MAPAERADLERLAQYIIRNPFSVEKMQVTEANTANTDGSIIYHSGIVIVRYLIPPARASVPWANATGGQQDYTYTNGTTVYHVNKFTTVGTSQLTVTKAAFGQLNHMNWVECSVAHWWHIYVAKKEK